MRRPVIFPLAVCGAIAACALLVNGIPEGVALLAPALLLLRKEKRAPLDRSAVRLALRLARRGQRTMLVEAGNRMQVVRPVDAAQGPRLQYVAALADGALILARRKSP